MQAMSSEEGDEDEDATKGRHEQTDGGEKLSESVGILNILASVKTSVVAAVLGTGSGRASLKAERLLLKLLVKERSSSPSATSH